MFDFLGGIRTVGLLLLILALGASAWWVKSRIDRSYDADRMQGDLINAKLDVISLQAKARIVERERLALIIKLGEARGSLDQAIGNAKSRVKVIVRDNPYCKLGPDAISLLNAARATPELPASTGKLAATSQKTPANRQN
jgi:hypothetical protein